MNKSLSRLLLGTSLLLGAPFMLPALTMQPAQARAACDVNCRYHCRKVFFKRTCIRKCKQEQKVSCQRTKPTITVINKCRHDVDVQVRFRKKNGGIYQLPRRVHRTPSIFGKDVFGSYEGTILDSGSRVTWKMPAAGLRPEYKIKTSSEKRWYGLSNNGKWRRLKSRNFSPVNPYFVSGRRNIKIYCGFI